MRQLLSYRLRIAAVLAAAVVIFGSVPSAWAYSGTGEGTTSNPYKISTCSQLQEIQNNLTASYTLTGDIDCSMSSSWNSGAGFIPVGDFTGTFDGQGFTISNIFINNGATNFTGLFGITNGATISNVHLRGGTVSEDPSSTYYTGSLVGYAISSTMSNVSSTATVHSQYGGG